MRNVAVLMSGTAIAQLLTTAAAPVLTRLYEPDAFGLLGIFLAIGGLISSVAALKYDVAIVLPEDDSEAGNVLVLGLLATFAITSVAGVLVVVSASQIAQWVNAPALADFLWIVPAYILAAGTYNTLNYWSTRRKQFRRLSVSRVSRSVGVVTTQLAAGLAAAGPGGLLIGQVAGQVLASVVLAWQVIREDLQRIRASVSRTQVLHVARKYVDFPRYSSPQSLLNSLSQAVPAFLLGGLFGPAVVGFYWFTYRLLLLPSDLIGRSVRQVFFQRASELYNTGGNVLSLLSKATAGLVVTALVPAAVILIGGSELFGFIFGDEWRAAGGYAQWMVLWWIFIFANPPAVMLIPILNLQRAHVIYEVVLLVARVCAILGGWYAESAFTAIALYATVGAMFNAGLIGFVFYRTHLVRKNRSVGSVPVTLST